MYHKHFNKIDSTQKFLLAHLKELKKEHELILITADHQTSGIGRKGNQWDTFSNSIAMSFILSPHPTPTMSPLEIGILIADFFNLKFNKKIELKWPNDLMANRLKCGGVLAQLIDPSTIVVGVGINLSHSKNEAPSTHYKHGLGYLFNYSDEQKDSTELIAKELYQYILNHRLNPAQTINKFNQLCAHLNAIVEVDDDQTLVKGKFIGIGEYGEALVSTEEKVFKLLSSSLRIISD